jgi:hypothetical protein
MAKSAVPATALFHAPSSEKREKGKKGSGTFSDPFGGLAFLVGKGS